MSQVPLHLLCVEPRFPGRLGAVADWLVRRRGYRCHFYCNSAEPRDRWPESVGRGLSVVSFQVGGVAREPSVAWQRAMERGLCYSYGCFEVLETKRPRPIDVILGRSDGLGSSLFVPVSLPRTPIVQLFDYYYHGRKNDLADEAGPETPAAYYHWRRAANAIDLLDLENGVHPWTATQWQRDLYPPEYRDDFLVLHDGVDTRLFSPGTPRPRSIAGMTIPEGMKVLGFVSRGLDRLRGFDRFLKLANVLMRERSDVMAIVVGDPKVTRSLDVAYHGRDYRAVALQNDPPPDPSRLWFLGEVPQSTLAEVFASIDIHVYAGRTFAVSRSLVQSMASGRVILASDDAPVRELIRTGVDGLLAPTDDPDRWVELARQVLDDLPGHRPLGLSAAEVVRERYSQDVTLPKLAERLQQLAGLGA